MSKRSPILLLTVLVAGVVSIAFARTELVHLRTASSRTFDNGEGTYTAEIVAKLDDSVEVRPDSASSTGEVEREWEQGLPPSYIKRTPGLKYGFEMELWPNPTAWTWHGFARFGLGSLPPGLQVVSADLWFYQYFAWHPTTSVDHLTLDPIQATAEEIWTASGTEICTLQLHSQSGWVVRQLNQAGRDAIEADASKGWFAVRINNEGVLESWGTAYGAGHDLEPRIKITYHDPGIQESPESTWGRQTGMSLVRGMLLLPGEHDAALLNTSGRRVMELKPGPNDIRHVAPGVYFVRQKGPRGQGSEGPSVRKVVIQR